MYKATHQLWDYQGYQESWSWAMLWVFVQLIYCPHWPMNQLNKNPNIAQLYRVSHPIMHRGFDDKFLEVPLPCLGIACCSSGPQDGGTPKNLSSRPLCMMGWETL